MTSVAFATTCRGARNHRSPRVTSSFSSSWIQSARGQLEIVRMELKSSTTNRESCGLQPRHYIAIRVAEANKRRMVSLEEGANAARRRPIEPMRTCRPSRSSTELVVLRLRISPPSPTLLLLGLQTLSRPPSTHPSIKAMLHGVGGRRRTENCLLHRHTVFWET
jgi:hypothetical protein